MTLSSEARTLVFKRLYLCDRKCDGQKPAMCSCEECTDDILDMETSAGGTCFERMKDTWNFLDISEDEACQIVSDDLPRECGPMCNPSKCDNKEAAHCSCRECTDFELNKMADGFTCFERMQSVQDELDFDEDDACRTVSTNFPEICGPRCHPGGSGNMETESSQHELMVFFVQTNVTVDRFTVVRHDMHN